MRAFFCDHYVLPLPADHRFPMAKYAQLRERVTSLPGITLHEPPAATLDELKAAHDAGYVDRAVNGDLSDAEVRRIGFPWSPLMIERSRRSAGATLAAARAVVDDNDPSSGRVAVNLAGGTHHAGPDFGAGYCVFNDVAVAVRVLMNERRIARALIVDLDVHQGDGTAAILGRDAGVFTLSLHGRNNFPFRKQKSSLDVELDDGCGDAEYAAHLDHALGVSFAQADPDVVFFLAGADPYEGDLLGRLRLSKAGLAARDAAVFAACAAHNVGVVVVMAGGYAKDVSDIVDIHAETVRQAAALSARKTKDKTRP